MTPATREQLMAEFDAKEERRLESKERIAEWRRQNPVAKTEPAPIRIKTLEESYMELAKECAEAKVELATLKESIKEALHAVQEDRNSNGAARAMYILNPCDTCQGSGERDTDFGPAACLDCWEG